MNSDSVILFDKQKIKRIKRKEKFVLQINPQTITRFFYEEPYVKLCHMYYYVFLVMIEEYSKKIQLFLSNS